MLKITTNKPSVSHARVLEAEFSGICSPENAHYLLKVLRLRAGDSFCVTNGRGKEASAVLKSGGTYSADEPIEPGRETGFEVRLFAGITKGDRFEFVIEKAVELGVTTIVPLISERTVIAPPSPGKLQRWEKIAVAAMLQCGGCRTPVIAKPIELKAVPRPDATHPGDSRVKALVLHEKLSAEGSREQSFPRNADTPHRGEIPRNDAPSRAFSGDMQAHDEQKPSAIASQNGGLEMRPNDPLIQGVSHHGKIWLASGPEGGFSPAEVDTFLKSGWEAIWLGPRLFRADTAPIIALARILLPELV